MIPTPPLLIAYATEKEHIRFDVHFTTIQNVKRYLQPSTINVLKQTFVNRISNFGKNFHICGKKNKQENIKAL